MFKNKVIFYEATGKPLNSRSLISTVQAILKLFSKTVVSQIASVVMAVGLHYRTATFPQLGNSSTQHNNGERLLVANVLQLKTIEFS